MGPLLQINEQECFMAVVDLQGFYINVIKYSLVISKGAGH